MFNVKYGVYDIAWRLYIYIRSWFTASSGNYNILEWDLATQKLFSRTCGGCWETSAFEVNMHPIMSLSWWACSAQSTAKWTGRNRDTGETVGGLEVVLLVPSSGKTADYGSWKIDVASVITNTAWSYVRLSEVVMKNWQSMRHFLGKLH